MVSAKMVMMKMIPARGWTKMNQTFFCASMMSPMLIEPTSMIGASSERPIASS